MALRDIFKFKKKTTTRPSPSHPSAGPLPKEKVVRPKEEIKEIKIEKPVEAPKGVVKRQLYYPSRVKKEIKVGEAYRVLKGPQVTEKATDLTKKNQYVFKIWPEVNKAEVKRAIEDLYGVDVLSVKTINVPSRQRRLGRIKGWRSGYKKAIVKIREGQKIEVLPR